MSDELRTLDDLDVDGQRVLLRADFNVPLMAAPAGEPVRVADDTRIRAGLTTIHELRRRGARLVIVSDLDRPKGQDPALSMRPVADRLGELAGAPVQFAAGVTGPHVRDLSERLEPGQMLMLENILFEAGEARGEPALAAALAELADVYVGDAFVAAQRSYASTSGVAHYLPSAAGRTMEREVHALGAIVDRPARPLVAILGGTKIRDKIGVLRRFLELADAVCIGGAMCFPFLAARGHSVGYSLCRKEDVGPARTALATTRGSAYRLELPTDLLVARWDPDGGFPHALPGWGRGTRRLDGARHRRRERSSVCRADRRGGNGLLERPDGPVRAPAIHRGHPHDRRRRRFDIGDVRDRRRGDGRGAAALRPAGSREPRLCRGYGDA